MLNEKFYFQFLCSMCLTGQELVLFTKSLSAADLAMGSDIDMGSCNDDVSPYDPSVTGEG
jgi:hypothetical protein